MEGDNSFAVIFLDRVISRLRETGHELVPSQQTSFLGMAGKPKQHMHTIVRCPLCSELELLCVPENCESLEDVDKNSIWSNRNAVSICKARFQNHWRTKGHDFESPFAPKTFRQGSENKAALLAKLRHKEKAFHLYPEPNMVQAPWAKESSASALVLQYQDNGVVEHETLRLIQQLLEEGKSALPHGIAQLLDCARSSINETARPRQLKAVSAVLLSKVYPIILALRKVLASRSGPSLVNRYDCVNRACFPQSDGVTRNCFLDAVMGLHDIQLRHGDDEILFGLAASAPSAPQPVEITDAGIAKLKREVCFNMQQHHLTQTKQTPRKAGHRKRKPQDATSGPMAKKANVNSALA